MTSDDIIAPASQGWVDANEAADLLGFHTKYAREQFRRAITDGKIPALKLSVKTIRIHMPTLIDKLNKEAKR